MEMRHDTIVRGGRTFLVVTFSGVIAPGSLGNADAVAGWTFIREHLEGSHEGLVLDLTGLDYVYGDYVGSWLLHPTATRRKVRVAASGRTAASLESLFHACGWESLLGEPLVHAGVEEALASFLPDVRIV